MDRRDWSTATRFQTAAAAWDRDRASGYLDLPPDQLDNRGRHLLRTLVVSEHLLGHLLAGQDDLACRDHFQAAYDLAARLGDAPGQAIAASSLGNAYRSVSGLRDLDQAQQWHQRSLDLKPEHDRFGRAATHGNLAAVAYDRFLDARASSAPTAQLVELLEQARADNQRTLDLLPDDHHLYRGNAHNQLGTVYAEVGDVPQALRQYQQSIQHKDARGDVYGAGQTRYNIAVLLTVARRPGDALHYARAALDNFLTIGAGAADRIAQSERLIRDLEAEIGQSGVT